MAVTPLRGTSPAIDRTAAGPPSSAGCSLRRYPCPMGTERILVAEAESGGKPMDGSFA